MKYSYKGIIGYARHKQAGRSPSQWPRGSRKAKPDKDGVQYIEVPIIGAELIDNSRYTAMNMHKVLKRNGIGRRRKVKLL